MPLRYREAEVFTGLVSKLQESERLAWLAWHGLRQSDAGEHERKRLYLQARAKLAVMWAEVNR